MKMEKLSKKLRGLTVRSDIIKLAEAYEAEQEKRVAELEAQLSSSQKRVSDLAQTVRSDIIKLAEAYEAEQEKRVAELEAQLSSSQKRVSDLARRRREHAILHIVKNGN